MSSLSSAGRSSSSPVASNSIEYAETRRKDGCVKERAGYQKREGCRGSEMRGSAGRGEVEEDLDWTETCFGQIHSAHPEPGYGATAADRRTERRMWSAHSPLGSRSTAPRDGPKPASIVRHLSVMPSLFFALPHMLSCTSHDSNTSKSSSYSTLSIASFSARLHATLSASLNQTWETAQAHDHAQHQFNGIPSKFRGGGD